MDARKLLIAFVLQFVFCSLAISQSKRISNVYLAEKFHHFANPDATLNHLNYFEKMSVDMGLSASSEMELKKTISGENGYTHFKYQQFHRGIPIFGNTYILHEIAGRVVTANGRYSPQVNVETNPSIEAETALKLAQYAMQASAYESHLPTPTLCLIDPAFPKMSESLLLVYQVDLQSVTPFDKQRFFIDAHSGEVIQQFPLILHEGVPSTAKTKYYGTQNIITDSIGPQQYVLHDPTRGEGITVFGLDGNGFTSTASDWDLANEIQDEVALDAHYCAQQFYDLLLENFAWQGLDGNGKEMIVNVHNNGAGEVNAFWTGESANYGDGNCIYGPLTTLEVVGHEFTHGIVDYTSDLIYSNESGAMNESMADIMGKALEYESDPANFSWSLGHSFHLSPEAKPFRVLDDPKSVEMPAYYGGEFWYDGGGVHTNSAIGNLWFVMLVDGRQGTNEAGIDFNVPSIGMDKASQIAFQTNKSYLTASSDYHDFYEFSLVAAAELYGAGAPEIAAVEEAWKAVGLPSNNTVTGLDLSVVEPFFYDRRCGLDEFFPVEVNITNLGDAEYLPAMGAVLKLSVTNNALPELNLPIGEAILPGEVMTVVVADWLKSDVPKTFNVQVKLELTDSNPDNNNSSLPFRIYEFSFGDLSLTTNYQLPPCFSTEMETAFYITNNGCEPIPAGTTYKLSVADSMGAVLWSEDYTLANDHIPFRSQFVIYQLDLGVAPKEELNFLVEFSEDPDTSNNSEVEVAPFYETITGDYLNDFEGDLAIDPTLYHSVDIPSPSILYDGSVYFVSTGRSTNPDRIDMCPDYEDNFGKTGFYSGNHGKIRTCLDLTGANTPYVSFDLVQFRNEEATADNYLYSCMLQTKWSGTDEGKEIIFGQNEGVPQQYGYSLPDDFKGELEFTFYTEYGQYIFNESSPNFDHDVLLMDNLQLQADFTKTTELENGKSVQVSPNPANSQLNIRSENRLTAVELRSINGQLLKQEKINASVFNFPIDEFENGVYLLRLQNSDGEWVVKKVVKME